MNHLGQKPGWNNGIYIGIFSISTCCRIFFPSTFVLCLCNLFEALAFASGGEGHHTQCSTALSGLVQVATGGPTPWEAWAMGNRCSWKDLKRNGTDGTRYWTTHNKTCTKTSLRLKFRLKAPGSIYFSIFFLNKLILHSIWIISCWKIILKLTYPFRTTSVDSPRSWPPSLRATAAASHVGAGIPVPRNCRSQQHESRVTPRSRPVF